MNAHRTFANFRQTTSTIFALGALALVVSAGDEPAGQVRPIGNEQAGAGSREQRMITGPSQPLNEVVAGGATLMFSLTPVVGYPGGVYNTGGAYSALNISGQTLTVGTGGFRSYWNFQLQNWNPGATDCSSPGQNGTSGRMRSFAARLKEPSLSSGSGDPLTRSMPACSSSADCTGLSGEPAASPSCNGGVCDAIWINNTRTDGLYHASTRCDQFACGIPIWFRSVSTLYVAGITDPSRPPSYNCAPYDRGIVEYLGTLALDVPVGASGTYTIEFIEVETYAYDDHGATGLPEAFPILALRPGVLTVTGLPRYAKVGVPSLAVPDAGTLSAIEVELISMPRFVCSHNSALGCNRDADCRAGNTCVESATPFPHEGEVRYAKLLGVVVDSPSQGTTMVAATLDCEPDYQDWDAATASHGGALYITGAEFVPRGDYRIRRLAESCMGAEPSCSAVSDPLHVRTAAWADVNGHSALNVLDIDDVQIAMRGLPGHLPKSS